MESTSPLDVDSPDFEHWLCHLLAMYCQKATYPFQIHFLIFPFLFSFYMTSLVAQTVKRLSTMWETWV